MTAEKLKRAVSEYGAYCATELGADNDDRLAEICTAIDEMAGDAETGRLVNAMPGNAVLIRASDGFYVTVMGAEHGSGNDAAAALKAAGIGEAESK